MLAEGDRGGQRCDRRAVHPGTIALICREEDLEEGHGRLRGEVAADARIGALTAGGAEEAGREMRESINHQNRLMRALAG